MEALIKIYILLKKLIDGLIHCWWISYGQMRNVELWVYFIRCSIKICLHDFVVFRDPMFSGISKALFV